MVNIVDMLCDCFVENATAPPLADCEELWHFASLAFSDGTVNRLTDRNWLHKTNIKTKYKQFGNHFVVLDFLFSRIDY